MKTIIFFKYGTGTGSHFRIPHPQISLKQYVNICEYFVYLIFGLPLPPPSAYLHIFDSFCSICIYIQRRLFFYQKKDKVKKIEKCIGKNYFTSNIF